MKTPILAGLIAVLTVSVGCTSAGRNTQAGTALGAALGAGAGAIIGHQTDDTGPGAAIGAGLGALAGGLIGNSLDRTEEDAAIAEQALYESELAAGQVSILDVIRMSQSGVSDRVIIAKIRQSGSVYDLSASDIIDLKRSSVSDAVIQQMIQGNPVRTRVVRSPVRVRTREVYTTCDPWWIPRVNLHAGYHWYGH